MVFAAGESLNFGESTTGTGTVTLIKGDSGPEVWDT